MRRFYLENVPEDNTARLTGDEARHIEKALRLVPGDGIELFDASGTVYQAEIESLHRGEARVRICARKGAAETAARIILCQALVKSQKMDFIVEKCTELGVTGIQPFFASRSVPRWDENKAAQRVQHWNNVARAAVKQSGARRPPVVEPVLSFTDVVEKQYSGYTRVMLWECERNISLRGLLADCRRGIVLMVGPEGGFSAAEAEQAAAGGFCFAGLGDRVLRAETAAITGVALSAYELGVICG